MMLGEKDLPHPFFHQIQYMAMADLDGKTRSLRHILHPFSDQFLICGIGENDAVTHFRKEPSKGKHLMKNKEFWGSLSLEPSEEDSLRLIRGKQNLLPLSKRSGRSVPFVLLNDIILLAATSIEEGFFPLPR